MASQKKRDEAPLERLIATGNEPSTARGFEPLPPAVPPILTTFRTPEGLVLIRGTSALPFCSVTFEPGPPPKVVAPALPITAPAAPVTSLWQERLTTMAKDAGLSETEYLEALLRRAWVMRPIDKKAG